MGLEKEGPKTGVGGFFHLFDWTAKSRKKLFSNKSDLPDHSKQGKRRDGNLPTTRISLIDDDEIVVGKSFKGSSDFSCASSVTDEEGCGSRAPSVVARLMGLESLPTPNFQEPYSTPFFDTRSLQDAHYHKKNLEYYNDHPIMYGGNMLKKVDGQSSRSFVEPKPKKTTPSRPIEKFQTEILPPKSAKSIPITHNKLLSPIKSPSFIPSNDAAHIMEAAAKIIEAGPQYPTKAKLPLVGSSSVPLKVQALREKVEATQKVTSVGSSSSAKAQDLREKVDARTSRLVDSSQRPVDSNAAKYLKGQSMTKSWNGSLDMSFRPYIDKEEGSGLKNKGKSISLAIQAKVNVQKREASHLSSSRSEVSERQQSEAKSSPTFRSQQNTQKGLHKKHSTQNPSGVLRQNNQKQNSQVDKGDMLSKPLVSNSQSRKLLSRDSSCRQKGSNRSCGNSKTGSRKSSLSVDGEKDAPYSIARNLPRKKRSIDGDLHFNKNPSNDKSLSAKNQKPVKCSSPVTDSYNWAEESRRKGMDVVSFTFTAPLTRSLPGSENPGQVGLRKNGFPVDNQGKRVLVDSDGMKLSSLGYNIISGDALSLLLEEKLRELTFGLESSVRDSMKAGSSSSSISQLENDIPPLDSFNNAARIKEQRDQFNGQFDFEFSSTGPPSLPKQSLQGVGEVDESCSGHFEAGNFCNCRQPSPVSILESSFSNESCNSSVTADSNSAEGSKMCSSVQAQEVNSLSFTKKFHLLEADTELSDSASSTSTTTLARKNVETSIMFDPVKANTGWEQEYVKEILCNVELMFNDFALGRSCEIIYPRLFNTLESRKRPFDSDAGETKLRRKVLFGCVSECLDSRLKGFVGGGYATWAKGVAIMRRKEWLAEEIYKEISGWESLGDSMVDELVDKDMSSQCGKWLGFEADEFALGADLEVQIFDSLIDELVAYMF